MKGMCGLLAAAAAASARTRPARVVRWACGGRLLQRAPGAQRSGALAPAWDDASQHYPQHAGVVFPTPLQARHTAHCGRGGGAAPSSVTQAPDACRAHRTTFFGLHAWMPCAVCLAACWCLRGCTALFALCQPAALPRPTIACRWRVGWAAGRLRQAAVAAAAAALARRQMMMRLRVRRRMALRGVQAQAQAIP